MQAQYGLLLIDNTGEDLLDRLARELSPELLNHFILGTPLPAAALRFGLLANPLNEEPRPLPTWQLAGASTSMTRWLQDWKPSALRALDTLHERTGSLAAASLRDRIAAHDLRYDGNLDIYSPLGGARNVPALVLGGAPPPVSFGGRYDDASLTMASMVRARIAEQGPPAWLNGRGLLTTYLAPVGGTFTAEQAQAALEDARLGGMFAVTASTSRIYNRRYGTLQYRQMPVTHETGMASSVAIPGADHTLLLEGNDIPPFGGYIGEHGALVRMPIGLRPTGSTAAAFLDYFTAVLDALWAHRTLSRRDMLARIALWQEHYATIAAEQAVTRWATLLTTREKDDLQREVNQNLEMQERAISNARSYARAARHAQLRLDAYIAGESDNAGRLAADLTALKKYLDNGRLTKVTSTDRALTVTTSPLFVQDERSGAWHALGPMEIIINMDSTALRFKRAEGGGVEAYNSGMQAPHVYRDGRSCPGNFNELQVDLFMNGDWMSLIDAGIAFLESANTEDAAGRYVHRWPFVKDPAAVGLPPYPNGFRGPWTDYGPSESTSDDYDDDYEEDDEGTDELYEALTERQAPPDDVPAEAH